MFRLAKRHLPASLMATGECRFGPRHLIQVTVFRAPRRRSEHRCERRPDIDKGPYGVFILHFSGIRQTPHRGRCHPWIA